METNRGIYTLVILLAAGAIVLALVLFAGGGENPQDAADSPPNNESGGGNQLEGLSEGQGQDVGSEQGPPVNAIEIIYNFDASEKPQLVGYSEAVFSGRAVRLAGEEPLMSTIPDDPGQPQEQWEVEVSEVLKGEGIQGLTSGATVVVNVAGGEDPRTGERVVISSAGSTPPAVDEPVEKGASYMFAVRDDEENDWLVLSAQPQGKVQVETRQDYDRVREEFVGALDEQVDPLEDQVVND